MKKLLKVTALALMGFASALVAKAEFAPEANHPYYLKLNGTEKTLDIKTPRTDNSDTNCAGVSTDKTPVLFEAGTGTNAGKFAVKCLQTGKYMAIHSTNSWNVYREDTPSYWSFTETSNGTLTIRESASSTKYLGVQSAHPDNIYKDCALSGTNPNCYWVLEDAAEDCTIVNVVYKVNGVTHYSSAGIWGHIGREMPSYFDSSTYQNATVPFFEADNIEVPSVVESDSEVVISGHYTHSLVITTDVDNPQYFLIQNVRTTGRGGVTYAATPGSSGQLELKLDEELNIDNHYHTGALWYMQTTGMVDSNGYLPVRLYNAYSNEAITNPGQGTWATSDDDNTIWYLKANTQSSGSVTYTGINILHAKDLTSNDYAWNDFGGSGTHVGYWKGNDSGSIWAFELADEAKASVTIDKINEAYIAERKAYVDLINSYVEIGLISFTEEQQSAWNAAATGRISNIKQLQTYMTTLQNQVNAAASNQVSDGQGRHVQFLHDQCPAYIGLTSDGSVRRGGEDGTRTFTLKNAADGSGFYIFNEYTNKYVKQPTADNTNISMVSDESEASIYNFDLENGTKGLAGVKVVGPSGHVNASHPYWHSNGNADLTNVVRWEHGDNSAWYLMFVDDSQAATEYLAGAMASSANLPESSNVVGFVSVDMELVNAVVAARAAGEAAEDAEAKRAAGEAIYSAFAAMQASEGLIYPRSGEIYTITSSDGRGILTLSNNSDNPYIWSTGATGYNANADKWAVVEKDGKKYLYNVFAGKFANAYGFLQNPTSNSLAGVTYAWMLCDVATEVTFNGNIFSQPTNGTTRPFVIAGGEDTTGKERPGMMIINWLNSPVPTIAGFGDNQDGCGFKFVKSGDVSEEQMATINAALDNMEAVAADTREAAEAMVADLPENYADIVNHFSEEGVETFNTRMALIDENATADKVYGICTQAMPALNSTITLSMTDGLCYSIANVSDGKKYHAFFGEASTKDFVEDDGDDIADIYNWRCTCEGNVVSFKHNLNENDVKFALNEVELFTLSAGSKIGQVKLTPFGAEESEVTARRVAALSDEGEEPAAEPEYILTSLGADATNTTTTAIAEITADGNDADVIYDLQGRRLSAPAKGINIINGKKILVY